MLIMSNAKAYEKKSTAGSASKSFGITPSQKPQGPTYDALRLYLSEIRRYSLLSREEERDLAIRYREKDDLEAGYRLVTANLRLVVKIAMGFQRHWMQHLMDLIQEGNVGLMHAVRKFDPYKGYKFSYYASFWIKAYMIKFIMDNWKLVKVGTTQAQRKLFFNLRKEKERLEAQGIEASPRLLSERLDVKESVVLEMDQRMTGHDVSLDAPLREDSEDTHIASLQNDAPSIDDQVADQQAREILRDKFHNFRERLDGKDAVIFDRRLLSDNPLTLQELGSMFGISRERVRQLESRIKDKLKVYLEEEIEDMDLFQESIIDV